MSRFAAAVFASLVLPCASLGAEITRVASSLEEDHPFGMLLQVGYERIQNRSKIVREAYQNGTTQDVSELFWQSVEQRLNVDVRIGIYRDVEFHYKLPFVFSKNQSWNFVSGTTPQNSTLVNNCVQPNGDLTDPNCASTGVGSQPIYTIPFNTYRGGIGNMTFGLKWAAFNEKKDDTKPTWVLGFDYEAPTAKLHNPTELTSPTNRGGVGDRNHHYTFFTALSKRRGIADPYVKFYYSVPSHGPGWYSNCDNPSASVGMGAPQNCNTAAWTRDDTGIKLPQLAGVLFGTELVFFEDPKQSQKVAIDVRGILNYVGPGRYSNELSDLAGRLLYSQDYLQAGGRLGFVAYAADWVQLTANADFTVNTEHTLTNEKIGKDLNGNGTVDVTSNPAERNPTFDWRTDMVGRRLRATENYNFGFQVLGTFSF